MCESRAGGASSHPGPALSRVSLPPAPRHCGIMHAQAGDSGLPEEVQCPEEAEGNSHTLQAGCRMHGGFVPHVGKDRVVPWG